MAATLTTKEIRDALPEFKDYSDADLVEHGRKLGINVEVPGANDWTIGVTNGIPYIGMPLRIFFASIIFYIVTFGIKKSNIKTANQQGRWVAGWALFLSALGTNPASARHGSIENYVAEVFVLVIVFGLIGYFSGIVWFYINKLKKSKPIFFGKIDEKFWGMAEHEFNNHRNAGAWAESFHESKGNENLAKAIYLKKRAVYFKQIYDLEEKNGNKPSQ